MPTVKPGTPATEAKRHQWEHQQHEGRQFPVRMGAEGWELVCVTEAVNGVRATGNSCGCIASPAVTSAKLTRPPCRSHARQLIQKSASR